MSKKIIIICAVVTGMILAGFHDSHALRLSTRSQALKNAFGSGCSFVKKTKVLSGSKLAYVKSKLGNRVGSHTVTFYFAVKNGREIGAGIVNTEPGKWGPVQFFVALRKNGRVKHVEVMAYSEKRGRPIARRNFLRQFNGKSANSGFQVNSDIRGISGATISSRAAAFAVKKCVILYKALFL